MKVDCIDFRSTNQFGKLFLDYIEQKKELSSFYQTYPTLENIEQVSNNYSPVNRGILVEVLKKQNKNSSAPTLENIEQLKLESTFTITTGHQLNLATGPLYFIFKILSTINTCEVLNQKYPEKHFVPVFWMASEDHDFDEINHFNLFGKRHQWNTTQTGAVGRFSTEGIQEVLEELPEKITLLEKAYSHPTLSLATRHLVNELFKDTGLIILDADDAKLKEEFSPIIQQELLERKTEGLVKSTSFELEQLNYKAQVHPREINLFYLTESSRERILFKDNSFLINNTDLSFSEKEMLEELRLYPERFSPNVILRPVYQQKILPNLSYIGGPGELAYWLQLKSTFDHYNVDFPCLQPRSFGLILNQGIQNKIEKLGLENEDLFKSYESLKNNYLKQNAKEVNLGEEQLDMKSAFNKIIAKGSKIDNSLKGALEAEWQRLEKQLVGTEKRIKKAEERKHDTVLNQYKNTLEKLFPAGQLQERHENVFSFLLNNPELITELKKSINFELSLKISRI